MWIVYIHNTCYFCIQSLCKSTQRYTSDTKTMCKLKCGTVFIHIFFSFLVVVVHIILNYIYERRSKSSCGFYFDRLTHNPISNEVISNSAYLRRLKWTLPNQKFTMNPNILCSAWSVFLSTVKKTLKITNQCDRI